MIPYDLLTKYGLPEEQAREAIETAVTYVLSAAFGADFLVQGQDSLEAYCLPFQNHPPRRIDLARLSRQLQRQIRFQIERELEKRQALHEWAVLSALRGRPVTGEIRRNSRSEVTVALEIEDHFSKLALTGVCPVRYLPPKERMSLAVGDVKSFLVTSVLPVMEKGRSKVLIRLSRTSRALPETLLRERTGEESVRCVRRIAGAFSRIESAKRLPRESIQEVGNELKERIIVRVVEEKNS